MNMSPGFDPKKPTALVLGRFQPFHEGHLAVITAAREAVGQVCVAIRDTPRDENNPFNYEQIATMMLRTDALVQHHCIIYVPNITRVVFGRTPGYTFQKVELPPEIEAISATALREKARTG